MRYTLENWRTEKIDIYKIPESILNNTISDVIHTMVNSRGLFFGLNLQEIIFLMIFSSQGWMVMRLPINRSDIVRRYFVDGILVKEYRVNKECLSGKGCPDFLLINRETREFRFVEVKFYEKSLSADQEKWARKYKYPFIIARTARLDLSDKENKKVNRLIRRNVY